MPKYLIEREIPGAASLSPAQLQSIAQKSNCAMEHLPGYTWHHSYVAGDKFYCVHEAADEETIREHARRGGFPVTHIAEIAAVVGPGTAEPAAPNRRVPAGRA